MFDKSKETQETINGAAKSVDEAAQEITKVAQTVESIKDHLRRNKKRYLIGGSVAIGTTIVGGGGILVGMKLAQNINDVDVSQSAHITGIQILPTNTIHQIQETIINLPARADRGHIIIDAATGLPVGASIKEAARNEGMSRGVMQDVLRGVRETAPNGKTYVDLGENLSEQIRRTTQQV